MKLPVRNLQGEQVGEVELPASVFGVSVNESLMHQALLRQNANAHLGTHDVKTRAEVDRTTKKAYRQKGTGRARQGSMKAPHWKGGGVAFGPHPRSYYQAMPVKMRRAAVRSALTQKATEQGIIVVDKFDMTEPKTKKLIAAMKALGVTKGLVVLPGRNPSIELSAHNAQSIKTLFVNYLNIRDIFTHDQVVISLDSLSLISSWLGKEAEIKEPQSDTDA